MQRQPIAIDLANNPHLRHLDTATLKALGHCARVYQLHPQEILLHQGDALRSFYIIQGGGLRLVEYTPGGQTLSLKIYGPGDIFGLLAISGSYPHSSQIEALTDCQIVAVDGQDARQIMADHPQLALVVIDLLTAHVHQAHYRIREMAAERVEQRLARALVYLSHKFGRDEAAKISINLPLSQRDLADFTASTVESINRNLMLWAKQGIVQCAHKHVDILDYEALIAIAEDRQIALQT